MQLLPLKLSESIEFSTDKIRSRKDEMSSSQLIKSNRANDLPSFIHFELNNLIIGIDIKDPLEMLEKMSTSSFEKDGNVAMASKILLKILGVI